MVFKINTQTVLITFLVFFFLISSSYSATFSRTQMMMGNVPVTLTVKASLKEKDQIFQAMEASFEIGREIEKKVSEFQPKSDTSRLNQHKGHWIHIGPELMTLLKTAYTISTLTDGIFDITFTSPHPSYKKVELNEEKSQAKIAPKTRIGVSSLAKGYIIDRMAEVLRQKGGKKFLVNAGGDLYAQGRWPILLRNPNTSSHALWLHANNEAICSSGLYERGAHIINPITHEKINPDYWGTTGRGKTAALTNPLTTAAFIMGPEKTENITHLLPKQKFIFLYNQTTKPIPKAVMAKHPKTFKATWDKDKPQ